MGIKCQQRRILEKDLGRCVQSGSELVRPVVIEETFQGRGSFMGNEKPAYDSGHAVKSFCFTMVWMCLEEWNVLGRQHGRLVADDNLSGTHLV